MEERIEADYDLSSWPFDQFSVSREERIRYAERKEDANELPLEPVRKSSGIKEQLIEVMMESKKVVDPLIRELTLPVRRIFTQYLSD